MMVNEEHDPQVWSGTTIDGVRQTWQMLYERERDLRMAADRWHVLVSDLDRCEHGRHQGDTCSQCGGPSIGNPLLPEGTIIGYSLSGTPYVVPPVREGHRYEAWCTGPVRPGSGVQG